MTSEINPIYFDSLLAQNGEYVPEFDLTYYDDLPAAEIREIESTQVKSWWESIKNDLIVEHEDVAESFAELKKSLYYMSEEDISQVEDAYLYTYFSHNFRSIDPAGRMRKNRVNHYTTHPIAVAHILAEMKLQKETVISALLHDVREDTFASAEEIYGLFGQRVGQNVEDVTKIHRSKKQDTEELQLYRLYLSVKDIAQGGNPEAVIIKLADKLHNMRTLDGIPNKKRQKEIAMDAYRIYVPLADKLGLTEIAEEIKYLSLKYTAKKVDSAKKRQDKWNEQIGSHTFIHLLKSLSQQSSFTMDVQKASLNLFIREVNKKGDEPNSANVTISYSSPEERDFWLNFIRSSFIARKEQPTRLSQGHWEFKSLPMGDTNWNITLLSEKNHELKNLRLTDRYKYGIDEEEYEEKRLQVNEKLSDIRDIISKYENGDIEQFIYAVTERLPFDRITVLTPKGEKVRVNIGSTAADFAYEIHQDLLPQAMGVRINGSEILPLKTLLNPGDRVSIEVEPTWEFVDSNFLTNGVITNPSALRHYKNTLAILVDRKKSENHYYRALTLSGLGSTDLEKKSTREEAKLTKIALDQLTVIYKARFSKEPEYDFSEVWDFVPDNFRVKFGSWEDFLYSLVLHDIEPRFVRSFLTSCELYQKTQYDSKTLFVKNKKGVIADFSTKLEEAGVDIIQFNRRVNNAKTPKGAAAIRILANPGTIGKQGVSQIVEELQEKYSPYSKQQVQTHLSDF